MEQTEIVLTPAERLILNSYRDLVCGLEDYLGIGYEIVLHSLESMEHSVIAIANGHYTNRHEGSPITDPLPSLSMVKTAGPLACCVSTFI